MLERIRILGWLCTALLIWGRCTPNHQLQNFEPTKSVSLPDILDQVPAIKSIWDSVDLAGLDQRAYRPPGSLSQEEIHQAIVGFMKLSEIARSLAPRLIDSVSGTLHNNYVRYAHRREAFNDSMQAIVKIAHGDPKSLSIFVLAVAEFTRIRANHEGLFPQATTRPFPNRAIFQDCNPDSAAFYAGSQAITPDPADVSGERKKLFKLYAGLRPIYCALATANETVWAQPSAFLYMAAQISRADNPLIDEAQLYAEIDATEANLPQLKLDEEELAHWLAKDPDLRHFTDFAAKAGEAVLNNTLLWPEIKTTLDIFSPVLAKKNPLSGGYLVSEALDAYQHDAANLKNLESYALDAKASSPLWQFAQNIFTHPEWGITATISRYGGGDYAAGKEKLMDMLWDGISFSHRTIYAEPFTKKSVCFNCGASSADVLTNDSDITYSNNLVGFLNVPVAINDTRTVNGSHASAFRQCIQDSILGNKDGRYAIWDHDYGDSTEPFMPYTHKAEGAGEVFVRNLMLVLYEKLHAKSGSPEATKGLYDVINQVEYSLHHAALMDRKGGGSDPLPLLTGFIFNTALGSGYIDEYFAPKEMLFQAALRAANPGDYYIQQFANTGNNRKYAWAVMPFMGDTQVPMYSNNGTWHSIAGSYYHQVFRNNIPWHPDLKMFTAEAITPGKFIRRQVNSSLPNAYLHSSWNGSISSQQGDVENANFRMGGLIPSLIALNTWQGHGPYTVKGRAPNGSTLKYKSDYVTDSYRSHMVVRKEPAGAAGSNVTINVAMGNNTGAHFGEVRDNPINDLINGTGWSFNQIIANGGFFYSPTNLVRLSDSYGGRTDIASSATSRSNLHIYEKIYRPIHSTDPCFAEASEDGRYPYARWGYLRPSNAASYHNNTNCTAWEKVQVDFDDRESAIIENARWLLQYKKLTIIIPSTGSDMTVGGDHLSLAVWSVNQANGLLGVMHLSPVNAGGGKFYNGAWNFFSPVCPSGYSGCSTCNPLQVTSTDGSHNVYQKCPFGTRYPTSSVIDMNSSGGANVIPNGTGFLSEPAQGDANVTHRFARSSFEAGDSSVSALVTAQGTGIVNTTDIMAGIFSAQKPNPGQTNATLEGLKSLEAIALGNYTTIDIVGSAYTPAQADFRKFRKFLDEYFRTDDYRADGTLGSDGIPDLWQMYERSQATPGCEKYGRRIDFCLTAKQMPYVPKVAGVSYVADFDAAGNPTQWKIWSGLNEHKFQKAILALIVASGSEYDARQAYVSPTNADACIFAGSITSQTLQDSACHILKPEENPDNFVLRGYLRRDYKTEVEYRALSDSISVLNETKLGLTAGQTAIPQYNAQALTNHLIETGPGLRNGLLPAVATTMYLHPPVIVHEFGKYLKAVFQNLQLLADGPSPSGVDKLRFILNGKLSEANGVSGNGMGLIAVAKQLVQTIREAGRDEKTLLMFRDLFTALNHLYIGSKTQGGFNIEAGDMANLYRLLLAKNAADQYVVDQMLDALQTNHFFPGTLDLDGLAASLAKLKRPFDDLNTAVIEIFGEKNDLRKSLLYGWLVAEPYVDINFNGKWDVGEPYVDRNGNGKHDGASIKFAETYPQRVADYTDQNGIYQISTAIPDFTNLSSLLFMRPLDITAAGETVPLTRSDIETLLNDLQDFQVYPTVLGNPLKKLLDDTMVAESYFDQNRNGVIAYNEIVDLNNNGIADSLPLRAYFDHLGSSAAQFVPANKNSLDAFIRTFDELFHPHCGGDLSPIGCQSTNAGYLTQNIVAARKKLFEQGDLKNIKLLPLKQTLGNFLYDADRGEYEYLISNTTASMLPIQRINVYGSAFGRDQLISELQPQAGGLAYVIDNLKLGGSYDAFDVFQDIHTLLTIKQIRRYDTPETLWWQAADLLHAFAGKAYVQHDQNFNLDPQLFPSFISLFQQAQK